MSLHDELVAGRPAIIRCTTCKFLATLSPADRAEWEAELRLSTNTHEVVAQAITRRGFPVLDGAVRTHRINHQ